MVLWQARVLLATLCSCPSFLQLHSALHLSAESLAPSVFVGKPQHVATKTIDKNDRLMACSPKRVYIAQTGHISVSLRLLGAFLGVRPF